MKHQHNEESSSKLAFSATVHCLTGCGIGEVAGVIIGVALGLASLASLILGITLGFIFGFMLGIIPLKRKGIKFKQAFKIIFLAEVISIAVMETTEVLIEIYTGTTSSGLSEPSFWIGMLLALIGGFIVTYPVNYLMVRRGIRHIH